MISICYRVAAAIVLGGYTLLPTAAQTTQTTSTDTYTILRIFKASDIERYKMKMDITIKSAQAGGADQVVKMNMLLKETIKSVSDSGAITVIDEYPKAEVGFNGQSMDITEQMPKITLTRDAGGHVTVKSDGGNEQANKQFEQISKSMFMQQANSMPKKPIKVGDSWTPDFASLSEAAGQKITTTLKLDAVEMVGKLKALKLVGVTDTTATGATDIKMHSETTTYLDANSFKLIKMTMKGSGVAAGNNMQSTMTIEPATAEDEKSTAAQAGPK